MRPERREHEAGIEEQDRIGIDSVNAVDQHVSRRGGKPLRGRPVRQRLHGWKNRRRFWLGTLSAATRGSLRRGVGIAAIFALLVVLLLCAPASVPAQNAGGGPSKSTSACAYVRLKNAPTWVVSGAWRGPRNLTLIDSFKSRIVDYRIDPRSSTAIPQELAQDMIPQKPVRIQAGGSGGPNLFVEFDGNRFRALDEKMRMVGGEDRIVGAAVPAKAARVGSLFDWQIAAGNVVAYGTLVHAANEEEWYNLENWRHGFIRYPYGQQWKVETFRQAKFPDPAQVFYRLGYPMLAAVGKDVYAVGIENLYPVLYQFPEGKPPLVRSGALPREIADRRLPALPSLVDRSDFSVVMKTVEASSMPAGLYGWQNSLFIIYRTPEENGTRWMISRIDGGRSPKLVPLPTRANHVTLIPGPENWALLEKGPIQELGTQELKRVILIPSQRFEGELSVPLCN